MRSLSPNRTIRRGVTLTEVLMSMMIMSIGVSLVATLFPIAALRSAQATKLTNGAVLKQNVEAHLRAQPSLIFDPDGDGDLVEHFRERSERRYIIDPIGYYNRAIDAVTAFPAAPPAYPTYFGNIFDPTPSAVVPAPLLKRYHAGILSPAATLAGYQFARANALNFATLGDSWETVVDTFAASVVPSSVGPGIVGVNLEETDLTDFEGVDSENYFASLGYDPENTRLTVFSVDGRRSLALPATRISGAQVLWTEEGGADYDGSGGITSRYLPPEFGGAVGRVIVQTKRNSDFSWLLTVRRGGDGRTNGIDVVVMYNDGLDLADERVHVTPPGEGFEVGDFDIAIPAVTVDGVEPFVKRGAFALDVDNARWYRVANYGEHPEAAGFIKITLAQSPIESSPPGPGGPAVGHVVLLPSVVDVFPLGGRPRPDGLPRNF